MRPLRISTCALLCRWKLVHDNRVSRHGGARCAYGARVRDFAVSVFHPLSDHLHTIIGSSRRLGSPRCFVHVYPVLSLYSHDATISHIIHITPISVYVRDSIRDRVYARVALPSLDSALFAQCVIPSVSPKSRAPRQRGQGLRRPCCRRGECVAVQTLAQRLAHQAPAPMRPRQSSRARRA